METSVEVKVSLYASVSPSEDAAKVLAAARNIMGECAYEVEQRDGSVTIRSNKIACLQNMHDQFRDRHVRAAANRLLLRMTEGTKVTILLNRQAATAGVVALCTSATESPLGPLVIEIESDKPQAVVDWLTTY